VATTICFGDRLQAKLCDILGFWRNVVDCLDPDDEGTNMSDKSLARPGRKQATATEDFEFHISYL